MRQLDLFEDNDSIEAMRSYLAMRVSNVDVQHLEAHRVREMFEGFAVGTAPKGKAS